MIPDPQDTIVALSSASGPGGRAVVRLSGPRALPISATMFQADEGLSNDGRRRYPGRILFPEPTAALDADHYFWPAPRTYTGQHLVEIHTLSCPPLLDLMIAQLLDAGARAARRGEFTMRAFLAGKLDLLRAEAVIGVIEAGNRDELLQALGQLAGGITEPLRSLRDDLLNLLADVEAGLDFTEEDLHFVRPEELLARLAKALALVTIVQRQLDSRGRDDRPFRVALAGPPNAGKSSLFNAIAGKDAALVSPDAGTTRDYLTQRLDLNGVPVELIDTAGRRAAADAIESASQEAGTIQAEEADLVLLCVAPGARIDEVRAGTAVLPVATKSDLREVGSTCLATSAVTGEGIAALRDVLEARARTRPVTPLAPSLSRCRHHVHACLEHLRQAHAIVIFEEPAELLALELRTAIDELGAMVGAIYTDDLLDRIFSRFCIGK